jgi:hypothetical protein
VGGQRGTLGEGSDIRSDQHTVAWSSIRVGMPASMETDAAGAGAGTSRQRCRRVTCMVE